MKKRELLKILTQAGWKYLREGRHEIWVKDERPSPSPGMPETSQRGRSTTF